MHSSSFCSIELPEVSKTEERSADLATAPEMARKVEMARRGEVGHAPRTACLTDSALGNFVVVVLLLGCITRCAILSPVLDIYCIGVLELLGSAWFVFLFRITFFFSS